MQGEDSKVQGETLSYLQFVEHDFTYFLFFTFCFESLEFPTTFDLVCQNLKAGEEVENYHQNVAFLQ